ncbi:MAG: OmpH family outer membrane protein [Ferruginibacter sp.]
MKNVSFILNVILIAAVVLLYVRVFGGASKNEKPIANKAVSNTNKEHLRSFTIAFVELDSLNEKIEFIKERRKELETEQKAIEIEWQSNYRGLENKKNEFLKRGNAITQQEAEKFQGELMQEQQQVDIRKQGLTQKLSEKSYKFMDDIQKKLKDFLNDYNKSKHYQYILTTGTGLDYMLYKDSTFNITDDVIKGMNEVINGKK